MLQKIASVNRFILGAVIKVQIIHLFFTRWKYSHSHFYGLFQYFSRKVSQKLFFKRVVSNIQDKVRTIGMLGGEQTLGACGVGGARQGHHFNAVLLSSVALAGHALEHMCFKRLHAVLAKLHFNSFEVLSSGGIYQGKYRYVKYSK